MNKQKFYKWYDKNAHSAVFPIPNIKGMDYKNRLIWQLKQIGVELLETIDMPIDVDSEFRHGKIPDWLQLVDDDEDFISSKIWDFVDDKDRVRLRTVVLGIGMASTHVITRYFANEIFMSGGICSSSNYVPAVYDSQSYEDEDKPDPIWIANGPGEDLQDVSQAESWLDDNFPCWRDPMLYWD